MSNLEAIVTTVTGTAISGVFKTFKSKNILVFNYNIYLFKFKSSKNKFI